jgi:hypothetical protein
MLKSNLKLLLASAAVLAAATPLPAQNQTDIVGPPALEDFDLGGERIVAQPPAPRPQQQTPPVAVVPAPPAPAQSQPRQERPEPPRTGTPRADTRPSPVPAPAEAVTPDTEAAAPGEPAVTPPPIPGPPTMSGPPHEGATVPAGALEDESGGFPVWPAVAGGLLLLGAGFFFGRRRAARLAPAGVGQGRAAVPESPEPARETPVPVVAAAAAATLAPKPRASLELLFEPTSTVLGDKEAIVHFLLTAHNAGPLPAKNVRLEARIFNAGGRVDADISQYFNAPLQRRIVTLPQPLPPGERFGIQGEVPIELSAIQPIQIEGRSLFIPIVAVTAIYEWEGGSGQTSKSYMVGVEASQAGKMGPFRLDQGPRVYRSVGQREHRLAKIA